ncbi:hypothetical protein DCO45_01970 [Comamonas sp. JNW]|nr:hypothetical protein DCO45_01970 [Comamonas sp. JNW]
MGACIHRLLDDQEWNDVVVALIPSLSLEDKDLLHRLVADDDFFLGEAVAMAIQKRPDQALLTMAQLAAAHAHPQVARAGKLAVKRIHQLGRRPQ